LTSQSREALYQLTSRGVPVINQTVLLRGINDDPEVLHSLFQGLLRWMVKPYYLFQGDLACGTSHFRVNLDKGIRLYECVKKKVSGLALPRFSLDLPRGGGKIILSPGMYSRQGEWYMLKDYNGKGYKYPVEHENV
jgi:lysine 2,3-aminomutase